MSILAVYIDDEIDSESGIGKVEALRKYGVDVVPVPRVDTAMPLLRQRAREVSVILLDILMPCGDAYTLEETNKGRDTGTRLLSDIRREFPEIPVIIISVKPPLEVQETIDRYRVEGYIYRPALVPEIVDEIRRVVKRQ